MADSDALEFPRASRRLRLGFVGGGRGSMIGHIQAKGARISDRWEVVAGALSSTPELAKASGADWFLAEDRIYTDYREMARMEADRPDGIDAVCIVTPNNVHYDMCCAFLDAGIDVICDKPLTTTLDDALDLVKRARESGLVFGVTHAFASYAMVRQARAMIKRGMIGRIRQIHVEYLQEFLIQPDAEKGKQFAWRTDPERSGPSTTTGDIGTHAWHMASFVSGLEMTKLRAEFHTCGRPIPMEDTCYMHTRWEGDVPGTLFVSQVTCGEAGGLRFRIFGDEGSLAWDQEFPEQLRYARVAEPTMTITRGAGAGILPEASRYVTLPRGHGEAWLEAWANLYTELGVAVLARREGWEVPAGLLEYPTVEDGARGIKLVDAAVKSNAEGGSWQDCALAL